MSAFATIQQACQAYGVAFKSRDIETHMEALIRDIRDVFHPGAEAAGPQNYQDETPLDPLIAATRYLELAMEQLPLAHLYMKARPAPGVLPSQHLVFCLTAQLQEIYVVRERVLMLLRTIQRTYRHSPHAQRIEQAAAEGIELITATLLSTTNVRSQHVHVAPFYFDEVLRLQLMEAIYEARPEKVESRILVELMKSRYSLSASLEESAAIVAQAVDDALAPIVAVVCPNAAFI